MQSVSARIWTRVTVSTSYDDNHYTTGTSFTHTHTHTHTHTYIYIYIYIYNFRFGSISSVFELALAFCQVACWILSSKIQLFSGLRSFQQMFSPNLLENFYLSFRVFCRERKRWKSPDDEYGGWGWTVQPKFNIFSCVILAECGFVLSWKNTFLLFNGVFLEDFRAHVTAVESINLYWVSALKTQYE